ncbi:hypothetical protein CNR22_21920 [Sphingobacteriaceae bacterium]|nr:hypothetical protein CNR22_21920 [Sphingobacteriaceae bacterium]
MSVQQTIIKGIKEQLFFNNYLVLPNFGGFVLKSTPSHFSASGGLLVPPSKTVSFNAQLKQNDGILAVWLQNALKCRANEALNHLTDFSEFCTGILNAKRRLALEGIGFFYLDFENNICFEPQQDSNFLTKSFGLGSVSIKELEITLTEPKKETVFVDRTLHTSEHISEPVNGPVKSRRNYSKIAIPVSLVAVLIALLGLLVNNTQFKGDLRASLYGETTKGIYTPLNYADLSILGSDIKQPTYVADANGIATLELDAKKHIAVKALENSFNTPDLKHSGSTHITNLGSGKFEIVLGCFTVLENAERMVSKLSSKHIRATVSGKNNKGMYVVSNGNYATKEEAITKLIEVKDFFPHAWIKKDQ